MKPMLKIIFFLSGATGVGYQVLWSKFLLDVIGVSAYSYSTVLAAFMGGLALGSWLLGRVADRTKSPIKLYAYLELGIGLYAVVYLPIANGFQSLYGQWMSSSGFATPSSGLWAKVLISGIMLIPPALLMGGTLPAMLRHVTEKVGLVGRRTSQYYALNAFGAAFGGLFMAFVLMPSLGMEAA